MIFLFGILLHEIFRLISFTFFFSLQYQLRSIGILGIAIATILHLRLSIPGPVTHFSTADNPTAKSNTVFTRFYSFSYLPVFNFKLLVYPHTLSFDWGMDAIPRITSLFDTRNIVSLLFYSALCRIVIKSVLLNRRATPKVNSTKRLGRTIQKRKHQGHGSKLFDDVPMVQSNQLWDSENSCLVCKQGLKHRHASAFQSNGNIGLAASLFGAQNGVSCSKKQIISLSPLKKYIRNNNSIYLNNNGLCKSDDVTNNNLNNNNNNNSSVYDFNNNSVCVNDNTCSLSPPATIVFQPSKHVHVNSHKKSVQSLSSRLTSIAGHIKCAEKSMRVAKLNGASAALISLAILTLPFLPASNLFFYVGFVVAERILYLPSVGYCLIIGLGLGKLINLKVESGSSVGKTRQKVEAQRHSTRSIATILLLIIMISAYSLKTIRRNRDWQDEESLYRSAIKINPPKGKVIGQQVLAAICFGFFSASTKSATLSICSHLSNKSFMQNLVYCLVEHFISEICLFGFPFLPCSRRYEKHLL